MARPNDEKSPKWLKIATTGNGPQKQQLTFSSLTELSLVILTRTKHMEDEPAIRAEQGWSGLHAVGCATRYDFL